MVRMKRRLSLAIQGETDAAIAAAVTAFGAGFRPEWPLLRTSNGSIGYGQNIYGISSSHGNPGTWFMQGGAP